GCEAGSGEYADAAKAYDNLGFARSYKFGGLAEYCARCAGTYGVENNALNAARLQGVERSCEVGLVAHYGFCYDEGALCYAGNIGAEVLEDVVAVEYAGRVGKANRGHVCGPPRAGWYPAVRAQKRETSRSPPFYPNLAANYSPKASRMLSAVLERTASVR